MNCPECKKELDHVYAYSTAFHKVSIDKDGHTDNWSSPDFLEGVEFNCPECFEDVSDKIKPT